MTEYAPLVILGAARSGTNMLRDALTRLPGFATWPCDEINPVWRHGNLVWPDDAIPPERAAGRPAASIRRAFDRVAARTGARVVVEKTCANTLRVPFVNTVLPEALFVHIVRDGRDVIASAARRWRGDLEVPGLAYRFAKARQAPLLDLPVYAAMYLKNRIALRRHKAMSVWGPRFPGMARMVAEGRPLAEICAAQWAASVDATDAALRTIPAERQLLLRYEDVLADPRAAMRAVLMLTGETAGERDIAASAAVVSSAPARRGQATDDAALAPLLAPLLRRHGYEVGA